MVNHGLATGLLFLVVGMFVARRGSALVSDFGGAGKLVPLLAGLLFFAGLASLALPGTAPFVSEFLVLIGTFTVHKAYAVIATAGIILAAAYVLWMVQRTTQGTLNPALTEVPAMQRDISLREKLVVAPLVLLLLLLGFYPKPVTDVINPAVQATLQDVGTTDPARRRSRTERWRRSHGHLKLPAIDYGALLPMLILFGAACLGVLLEAVMPRRSRNAIQLTSRCSPLVAALVAVIVERGTRIVTIGGAVAVDGPTLFLQGALLRARRRVAAADRGAPRRDGRSVRLPGRRSRSARRRTSSRPAASPAPPRSTR